MKRQKKIVYKNVNFQQTPLTIPNSKKSHRITDIESNQKTQWIA